MAGWHKAPAKWELTGSEERNGNSIVAKLTYKGSSILFTGDSVGRDENSEDPSYLIATEKYLIDNNGLRNISSTVLIAPHHGGNDASSSPFIKTVNANWVIFSSGSKYQHPRKDVVLRYINAGYKPDQLLRTDLGDIARSEEWLTPHELNKGDHAGDDCILIKFDHKQNQSVEYIECVNNEH